MKVKKILSLILACSMVLSLTGVTASAGKINPDPPVNTADTVYTVVKGDSLWQIAARNGLTLAELLAMNPQIKNPAMIYVGDQVVVARRSAPAEPIHDPAQPDQPAVQPADLVLKNGTIQTMVSENDVKQALAVRGNEIVYVGDNAGVAAYVGEKTRVIDLNGQFVSPGFMDGHIHTPGAWDSRLYEINLEGMTTKEEYLDTIQKFVAANPDLPVYSGGTFMLNAYKLADGSNPGPRKEDLDAICSDKPIIIRDVSYHSAWVNSYALELAGITRDTPDPKGGIIKKNAQGEPSGFLTDAAADLVTSVVPVVEYTDEMRDASLTAFMEEANAWGVTGMTGLSGGSTRVEDLWRMEREGKLTLRIRPLYTTAPGEDPQDVIDIVNGWKAGATDLVQPGTVKIFSDGVTESATAVMLNPYLPEAGKGESWCGEPVWNTEDFNQMILALDKAGIQAHTHAIGDGAVQMTLDAYALAQETNGVRDSRHTITHVCAITKDDIVRMADLKVVGALQFLWMYADPLYELEAAFIGTERAQAMYPTKDMAAAGIIIAGASDSPVTNYNVLDEIEVGVTRNSPFSGEEDTNMYRWADQALTAYQMLEAYTKNVAYENFMDDEIGTIEVGKKADLVVLGQNILTCDPKTISDTEIVYTISDGRVVYSAK